MLHLTNDDLSPVNDLIVAVFRLSGSLLDAGSRLVKDIGLTPAWWQVVGALALSPVPLTVPQIARNMGLARQSVQRIVDLLIVTDFVRLEPNPHHRRAKLVALSAAGERVYLEAQERQRPWSAALAEVVAEEDLRTAVRVLRALDATLAGHERPADAEGAG